MKRIRTISMMATLVMWGGHAPSASAQITQNWTIDRAAAERGQQAFVSNCAFCHGSDARGSERAPDLLRSELVNRDDQGELIGQVVTTGRLDKGMPSFPNLSGQVKDIANFLHDRIESAANRYEYKILNIVTGDPKRGEAYFKGAGGCARCHSAAGDLAGVGGKYKPDELQALMVYPGPNAMSLLGFNLRHSDNPPVHIAATLKSGEIVSGTAVSVGEFDISLHDETGAYRSFPRDAATKLDIQDPLEAHSRLQSKLTDREMHDLLAYLAGLK